MPVEAYLMVGFWELQIKSTGAAQIGHPFADFDKCYGDELSVR